MRPENGIEGERENKGFGEKKASTEIIKSINNKKREKKVTSFLEIVCDLWLSI